MKRKLEITERSKRVVCEGCESVRNLTKVGKRTWAPFFLCRECLEEELAENVEITLNPSSKWEMEQEN